MYSSGFVASNVYVTDFRSYERITVETRAVKTGTNSTSSTLVLRHSFETGKRGCLLLCQLCVSCVLPKKKKWEWIRGRCRC